MSNPYFNLRQSIQDEIRRIPRSNRYKFYSDYLALIRLAQKDDYHEFNIDQ